MPLRDSLSDTYPKCDLPFGSCVCAGELEKDAERIRKQMAMEEKVARLAAEREAYLARLREEERVCALVAHTHCPRCGCVYSARHHYTTLDTAPRTPRCVHALFSPSLFHNTHVPLRLYSSHHHYDTTDIPR